MTDGDETTAETAKKNETGRRAVLLLDELIIAFPEHDTDEEVNGADTVEWLMNYITRAKELLK